MAVIPPWISVTPDMFVKAAEGGARIGAELAGQGTEANIASGRNATALQEAQMRINAEQSGQQNSAQQAAAERVLREWEMRQQILHQSAQLQGENQRNQNTVDSENQRAAAALAERQGYGNSMIDIHREANRIAQERADAAAKKPAAGDFTTVSEHTKEIPDAKTYGVTEPEIHNFFSKNIPGKTFNTTNALDLANLPHGSSIVTNSTPGTGTPARTISRRIPIGQDPNALSMPSAPPKPIKDKSGVQWLYHGTMADPTQDKDQSNWELVQ